MDKNYKINLLDKVNEIQDEKIRKLACKAISSAIERSREGMSDDSIADSLNRVIEKESSELLQEM